jgi:hypothetical protein
MNRIQYQQAPGNTALVFKLKGRAPEGKILTTKEIEEIGYEWGILERTDKETESIPIGEYYTCGIVTGAWGDNPVCPGCGDDLQ